jgi:hypothetical protein
MIDEVKMRLLLCILVFTFPVSCLKRVPAQSDSDIFSGPQRLGQLTNKKLNEASGLAASANNPGLLWTLNDSGNPAEIFLVDESLSIKLTCRIAGAKNRDWEDIAVGPGPEKGKSYVYVADIGDNNSNRLFKHIYRFPEPVTGDESVEISITEFDTIIFRLEDGKKDAEAIMIEPKSKDLFVISKREKPVYVYRLKNPSEVHDTLTAQKVCSLPLTQIVSAGISPNGNEILLKNYENIYYWNTTGKPLLETLKQRPQILKYIPEPQGEAIAFKRDGSGFFTLSEKIPSEKVYLYYYARQKP